MRTLVDIARLAERFNMRSQSRALPSDSTCVLKAEPGKLIIKRHSPDILFISLPHCFTLQTSDNDIIFDFCVDSVIQKVQRHLDMIKAHAVR